MTEATMQIPVNDRDLLPISRSTREALAKWARAEFSSYKAVARQFDLTPHQARTVLAGAATADTIDLIWRHENGGLRVALPVILAVAGSSVDELLTSQKQWIADERCRADEEAARMDQMARDMRALLGLALPGAVARDPERTRASRPRGRGADR